MPDATAKRKNAARGSCMFIPPPARDPVPAGLMGVSKPPTTVGSLSSRRLALFWIGFVASGIRPFNGLNRTRSCASLGNRRTKGGAGSAAGATGLRLPGAEFCSLLPINAAVLYAEKTTPGETLMRSATPALGLEMGAARERHAVRPAAFIAIWLRGSLREISVPVSGSATDGGAAGQPTGCRGPSVGRLQRRACRGVYRGESRPSAVSLLSYSALPRRRFTRPA